MCCIIAFLTKKLFFFSKYYFDRIVHNTNTLMMVYKNSFLILWWLALIALFSLHSSEYFEIKLVISHAIFEIWHYFWQKRCLFNQFNFDKKRLNMSSFQPVSTKKDIICRKRHMKYDQNFFKLLRTTIGLEKIEKQTSGGKNHLWQFSLRTILKD